MQNIGWTKYSSVQEKSLTYMDVMNRGQSNPLSCVFGHFRHGLILVQVCSWPVRRQSFAVVTSTQNISTKRNHCINHIFGWSHWVLRRCLIRLLLLQDAEFSPVCEKCWCWMHQKPLISWASASSPPSPPTAVKRGLCWNSILDELKISRHNVEGISWPSDIFGRKILTQKYLLECSNSKYMYKMGCLL